MTLFKTLEFTNEKERISFGRYAHFISDSEFAGSEIPNLMRMEASIEDLKKLYPKQDFEGVRLIVLKVSDFEPDNT